MSKPDDVSQEVWDDAEDAASIVFDASVDLYEVGTSGADPTLVIARAILAAEKRGEDRERDEILTLVSEYVWDEHALAQATDIGRAVHHQSVEIAAAIRARSTP